MQRHGAGFFSCNLARPRDVADLAAMLVVEHPDINIVINNAGVQYAVELSEASLEQFQEEAMVNLVAPALIARAFLPHLRQRPHPTGIVNIGSGLAFHPKRDTALYCATKAGLHSLSRSLRYAAADSQVSISEAVLPLVDTRMTRGRGAGKLSPDAAARAILKGTRLGREEIWVGKAALLPLLNRVAPSFAARLLKG